MASGPKPAESPAPSDELFPLLVLPQHRSVPIPGSTPGNTPPALQPRPAFACVLEGVLAAGLHAVTVDGHQLLGLGGGGFGVFFVFVFFLVFKLYAHQAKLGKYHPN